MLGDVLPQQQQTIYTCSAATLSAVLKHFGVSISEPVLTKVIGALPAIGATSEQVAAAAKRLGFAADVHVFRSLDELAPYLDSKPLLPVIANIFSFNRPGTGHFVVITDITPTHVRIMDPNSPTNWRDLARSEMEARWLGRGGIGVIVRPSSVKTTAQFGDDQIVVPKNTVGAVVAVTAGWLALVGFTVWQQERRNREQQQRQQRRRRRQR